MKLCTTCKGNSPTEEEVQNDGGGPVCPRCGGDGIVECSLPMQPIEFDDHDIIRFKANRIVRYILDNGGIDMNHLAVQGQSSGWTPEEFQQFAQLIGYSVSGFGDLSYADPDVVAEADMIAGLLGKKK